MAEGLEARLLLVKANLALSLGVLKARGVRASVKGSGENLRAGLKAEARLKLFRQRLGRLEQHRISLT